MHHTGAWCEERLCACWRFFLHPSGCLVELPVVQLHSCQRKIMRSSEPFRPDMILHQSLHYNTWPEFEAQKAFVHLDCSRRVQRALTRNASVFDREFNIGDLVTFRRDNQRGGTSWSPTCRVIGHENQKKHMVAMW